MSPVNQRQGRNHGYIPKRYNQIQGVMFISANFITAIFQNFPQIFGLCVFRAIYFITVILLLGFPFQLFFTKNRSVLNLWFWTQRFSEFTFYILYLWIKSTIWDISLSSENCEKQSIWKDDGIKRLHIKYLLLSIHCAPAKLAMHVKASHFSSHSGSLIELVSKELNHLAAILHV